MVAPTKSSDKTNDFEPKIWNEISVAELTTEVGDGIHATPKYSKQGTYYFINGNNISNGKIKIDEDTKKVDDSEYSKHSKRLEANSTILLSINGTIGNLAIYDGEPVLLGKSAAYIKPKSNYSVKYLYYSFQSKHVLDQFSNGLTGTTIKNLGLGTIRNSVIRIPKAQQEQEAIANALSDADAYIETLEKLVEKKRLIKKGVMQELLTGKRRLPGFDNQWVVLKLSELISFVVDNRGKTPKVVDSGYPLLEANSIKDGQRLPDLKKVSKYVDYHTYKNWFRDGHPENGDVLFVTVGSAGASCIVENEIISIAQNIISVRIRDKFDKKYFYYFTQTEGFKKQVSAVLMGAVQPSLKVPHLMNFDIPISTNLEEQSDIGKILWDLDQTIEELELKIEKARKIKQGMMQELLTGRIRLI